MADYKSCEDNRVILKNDEHYTAMRCIFTGYKGD